MLGSALATVWDKAVNLDRNIHRPSTPYRFPNFSVISRAVRGIKNKVHHKYIFEHRCIYFSQQDFRNREYVYQGLFLSHSHDTDSPDYRH